MPSLSFELLLWGPSEQGATEGWAAAQDWRAPDGSVDLDFLEQRFGNAQVLVTDTARRVLSQAGAC